MSNKWSTYLGHDRPLPMGEQSHREYHSGDPSPEAHCVDCGNALYESDYAVIDQDTYCWSCAPDTPSIYRRTALGYHPLRRGKYIPDPDEMGDDPDWGTYQ